MQIDGEMWRVGARRQSRVLTPKQLTSCERHRVGGTSAASEDNGIGRHFRSRYSTIWEGVEGLRR